MGAKHVLVVGPLHSKAAELHLLATHLRSFLVAFSPSASSSSPKVRVSIVDVSPAACQLAGHATDKPEREGEVREGEGEEREGDGREGEARMELEGEGRDAGGWEGEEGCRGRLGKEGEESEATISVISIKEVLKYHPNYDALRDADGQIPQEKGPAVSAVSVALVGFLKAREAKGGVLGVLGVGEGAGTGLISTAFRVLSIGIPKLLLSDSTSMNTARYVGASDIIFTSRALDRNDCNSTIQRVIANAAAAMAGMVTASLASMGSSSIAASDLCGEETEPEPFIVGITASAATMTCVETVKQQLEATGLQTVVFHVDGSRERHLEENCTPDKVQVLIDITAIADATIFGGEGGRNSLAMTSMIHNIPHVLSVGMLDTIQFGGSETIPTEYSKRKFHFRNKHVLPPLLHLPLL